MRALCIVLFLCACNSNAENICEDIGDCTQGGSSDWITACKTESQKLRNEAIATSCTAELDAYEQCQSDKFDCEGATSLFPGCDAQRAALETCLSAATTSTACAELAAKTASCQAADGGAIVACSPLRDCEARCFLVNVADPCAPNAAELETNATCASSCPP